MKHPVQEGSSRPTIYGIPVLNTHSEPVPPNGIMQVVDATEVLVEDTVYDITKPNGSGAPLFLVNGPVEIPPGEPGFGTNDYPCDAAYNGFTGTPNAGDEWGPVADSWLLSFTGRGFLILGGRHPGDPSLVRVAAKADGGTDRLVAADPTDGQPGTLIEKVTDNFTTYNPLIHQLVTAQTVVGVGDVHSVRFFTLKGVSTEYFAGCGLNLNAQTKTFGVDAFRLVAAAGGLYALTDAQGCTRLAIDHDCGLKITEEEGRPPGFKLRLDMQSLVGRGLAQTGTTGECPKVAVDTGLGVTIEDNLSAPNGEVALFRDGYTQFEAQLYGHYESPGVDGGNFAHFRIGCGLFISPLDGALSVNLNQIHGDNLFYDQVACKLHAISYLNGCAIDIQQHPQLERVQIVNVDVESLKGPGLKTALTANNCKRLEVDYGCGLKLDGNQIIVDAQNLVGHGLNWIQGSGQPGCDFIEVNTGLGLWLDPIKVPHEEPTAEVALHPTLFHPDFTQLYGHQAGAGENFRHIFLGCGLKYQNGAIMVDNEAIANESLGTIVKNGNCGLVAIGEGAEPPELYTSGCGIDISPTNVISVVNIPLAGCGLDPGPGCSLNFAPAEVAGDGLESVGGSDNCKMQLNIDCGLEFVNDSPTRAVRVKLANPSGLVCLPDGLIVNTGCGLELTTEDNCVKVKPADLAGPGLIPAAGGEADCDGPCQLAVGEGCGISVTADAVSVKRSDLIGPGIKAGPGTCNLAVDATTLIKSFDRCELNLVGNQLRMRIHYKQYRVYVDPTPIADSFSDCEVMTIECPP